MAAGDVRRLFDFIDWVLELPDPLDQLFREELAIFQQENQMPFLNTFQRAALQQGLLEGIEVALDVKFGAEGLEMMPEIREIRDHDMLREILGKIKAAGSRDEVRRVWTRRRRPKKSDPM
jgi:hypothetical protein